MTIMAEAYIIDAVRSPVGKRNGGLSKVHPIDLGAHALKALMDRAKIDPAAVEDVIMGCVDTIGPQAGDIGRNCWLAAGLSDEVPGVTLDRQCGSSQQALHFAAQAVMSGTADLIVAAGVQNMSMVPIGAAMITGKEFDLPERLIGSKGWVARYGTQPVSQFRSAEMIAQKWEITREDMERFALESHQRAVRATEEGRFDREIVPLGDVKHDEGPRRETSLAKMATLKTIEEGGRLTAAVSSQISDGASAVLVASERAVKEHNLRPRARIHNLTVRGADPIWMLTAPIPATILAMKRAGMKLDDIDLVEINEAFASVVLAWERELGVDHAKVNVNGGAISLGHPLGATGLRLMSTLLCELERTNKRYGLQTMCEGGGQANVTIIERLLANARGRVLHDDAAAQGGGLGLRQGHGQLGAVPHRLPEAREARRDRLGLDAQGRRRHPEPGRRAPRPHHRVDGPRARLLHAHRAERERRWRRDPGHVPGRRRAPTAPAPARPRRPLLPLAFLVAPRERTRPRRAARGRAGRGGHHAHLHPPHGRRRPHRPARQRHARPGAAARGRGSRQQDRRAPRASLRVAGREGSLTRESDRRNRILDVAIALAEADGFDNVRQRDVAEQAGVALGTLYKSFRGKEDILCAALEREAASLERQLAKAPVEGATPIARVSALFDVFTRTICDKPNFGRAVLRAMASGVPEVAGNVAAYHGRLSGLVIAAMRGQGVLADGNPSPTEDETTLTFLLLQVWFASLVGWSARLIEQPQIGEQVEQCAKLLWRALKRGT
jgi:acetyl-CoA C-acetyltransferase